MDFRLCSRCIAEFLTNVAYQPRVDWGPRSEEDRDLWLSRFPEALKPFTEPGPGALLVKVLEFALERGHPVYDANMYRMETVTTWHGDPICWSHLTKAYANETNARRY
jgi:hypothetical protein